MSYLNTLASLASAPKAAPASLGVGTPPQMPGLPPAPTGIGAMPTGSAGTTPKGAADSAILYLREAQGHFPAMKQQIDAMIESLKSAASSNAPTAAPGQPSPLGTPTPAAPPIANSGSAGSM